MSCTELELDLKANQKIRFLIESGVTASPFRSLAWIRTSSDGSILIGPYAANVGSVRQGVTRAGAGESFQIDLTGGEAIPNAENAETYYLSFHASGRVNSHFPEIPQRARLSSLRAFTQRELLCTIVFSRWPAFPLVQKQRKLDLRFDVDAKMPLVAEFHITPLLQAKRLALTPKGQILRAQFVLKVRSRVSEMQDMCIQALFYQVAGPFLAGTVFSWPARENDPVQPGAG